jgi:hypothetical protein
MQSNVISAIECTENSTCTEHSNTTCFEEVVFLDIKTNLNPYFNKVEHSFCFIINIKDNFNASIWQPPKLS